ncbi:double-strand break repair protein AddB [Gimibacter soli]|uniref:Double-strand break repair protein AddB n=1 Tax=Gimibacter soli TaxID=3024400 RepID=A0AAE9XQ33_9PROT|nr:double-strand break repair protein AddB [Gimibacter soli]WCL54184.1 double-strand break repair protein AddB [Gimibacter soli]
MIRAAAPKVFTIDPALPFADALVRGLMARVEAAGIPLSDVTLLVPNRRSQRALREAFLRMLPGAGGDRALVLPVMRAVGDVEDEELILSPAGLGAEAGALPPAIGDIRRLGLLLECLTRWQKEARRALDLGALSPAQGWRLARTLARLMDEMETAGADFAKLKDLVPEEFAKHWGITLEFLEIVTRIWPAVLAEEGAMNPAARRDTMIRQLAALWADHPPKGMVVAAGSTGSVPATAELLKVVSRLPEGMVVLPGLDTEIDADAWAVIDAKAHRNQTHPQAMLKALLETMQVSRDEVEPWDESAAPDGGSDGRLSLIIDALRPAEATGYWQSAGYRERAEVDIFVGMEMIEAPTEREEAAAIACVMREAIETPECTAALVTPDRALARYVKAELARFGVKVDDSAGDPAILSLTGRFLLLLAEAAAKHFAPVPLLALLQHPFAAAGEARGPFLDWVRRLDRLVLRGPRPAAGLAGLMDRAKAAKGFEKDVKRLERLIHILKPFEDAVDEDKAAGLVLKAHLTVAEALAANDHDTGDVVLWRGEAGNAIAALLAEIIDEAPIAGPIGGDAYAALFAEWLIGLVVRPVWGRHPRLMILGPLEARLIRADVMILGGLNEGSWPREPVRDPWMNGEMRRKLDLPSEDRKVGQAAHDFLMAAAAPRVILSRALKVAGSPTVQSRWLFRIEALAGKPVPRAHRYLDWAAALDAPVAPVRIEAPAPKPAVEARPKRLSVTQVETLMRDPYSLYARKVLGLEVLDALDEPPNAAKKGTLLHDALERFLAEPGPRVGEAGVERLLAIGRESFAPVLSQPGVYAFWWPRFERIARWFVENEAVRAETHETLAVEVWAERPLPGRDFTLFAKADRIDRKREDGSLVIIDYKTGNVPTAKRIEAGFAPQLPLEGWLAEAGGFKDVPLGQVGDLVFWHISGGDPIQEEKSPVKDVRGTIDAAAEGLMRLVDAFANPDTAYLSNPRAHEHGYGDYDHLARLKEWRDARDPFEGGEA